MANFCAAHSLTIFESPEKALVRDENKRNKSEKEKRQENKRGKHRVGLKSEIKRKDVDLILRSLTNVVVFLLNCVLYFFNCPLLLFKSLSYQNLSEFH